MAPRPAPRVFNLSPYPGAPMVNLATGQVTRRKGKKLTRTPLTDGQFDVGNAGGIRILRGQKTNTMGTRDLVVNQRGQVVANVRTGSNPQLRWVGEGTNRRLVVGRGSATTGGGAAPTAPGAGLLADVTNDPNLIKSTKDPTLWTGRNKPNSRTLDTQFGAGGWYVEQTADGKYVVKKRDNSPYAAYNDYPWIRRHLEGLDRGYDQFQSYLTNTYNPMVTAGAKSLTDARLASGNAYNAAVQNYANSAGNVASAMTTPQVAGMSGGTVQAPNQNALGAAQSMAATANVGRNMDAGYRTALGGLEAEKMSQSFQSSALGYGAGLLNQYGQKRQAERLKMDQWIEEQKTAQKNYELQLARMDQSMINSLIVSGDRAAAREVTQRGQDITADTATANRTAAQQDKYSANAWKTRGWQELPRGAGTKGLNTVTSSDGVVLFKPKSGGGAKPPTDSARAARVNDFKSKWTSNGQIDPRTGLEKPPVWGKGQGKIDAGARFLKTYISLFPGLKKGKRAEAENFLILAGVKNPKVRGKIIDAAIQLIARG